MLRPETSSPAMIFFFFFSLFLIITQPLSALESQLHLPAFKGLSASGEWAAFIEYTPEGAAATIYRPVNQGSRVKRDLPVRVELYPSKPPLSMFTEWARGTSLLSSLIREYRIMTEPPASPSLVSPDGLKTVWYEVSNLTERKVTGAIEFTEYTGTIRYFIYTGGTIVELASIPFRVSNAFSKMAVTYFEAVWDEKNRTCAIYGTTVTGGSESLTESSDFVFFRKYQLPERCYPVTSSGELKRIMLQNGQRWYRIGFNAEAARNFRTLVSFFPDEPLALYNLACSTSDMKELLNSIKKLRELADRGDLDAAIYIDRARVAPELARAREYREFIRLVMDR